MGVTGTVTVRLLVNAAGGVEQAHVVSATPPGVFEASVLEAVRQWRFLPARRAGKAVAAWVVAPVRFDLRG